MQATENQSNEYKALCVAVRSCVMLYMRRAQTQALQGERKGKILIRVASQNLAHMTTMCASIIRMEAPGGNPVPWTSREFTELEKAIYETGELIDVSVVEKEIPRHGAYFVDFSPYRYREYAQFFEDVTPCDKYIRYKLVEKHCMNWSNEEGSGEYFLKRAYKLNDVFPTKEDMLALDIPLGSKIHMNRTVLIDCAPALVPFFATLKSGILEWKAAAEYKESPTRAQITLAEEDITEADLSQARQCGVYFGYVGSRIYLPQLTTDHLRRLEVRALATSFTPDVSLGTFVPDDKYSIYTCVHLQPGDKTQWQFFEKL